MASAMRSQSLSSGSRGSPHGSSTGSPKLKFSQPTTGKPSKKPRHMCPPCKKLVSDSNDSMLCDKCHSYTHLKCESKISKELYEALNKYPDNPLLYLCGACRETSPVDSLSCRSNGQELSDKVAGLRESLESANKKVTERLDSLTVGVSKILDVSETTKNISDQLAPQSYFVSKFDSIQEQVDSLKDISETTKNISDQLAPQSYFVSKFDGMQDQVDSLKELCSSMQTIITKSTGLQSSGKMAGLFSKSSLPIQQAIETEPRPVEVSLVVYNIPNTIPAGAAVQQLAARCNFPKKDIIAVNRFQSRADASAVEVQCVDEKAKWKFLKRLNEYKIEGTFARLYLCSEDRVKDRQLVSTLRRLRRENPHKYLKIHKGCIVEEFDELQDQYVVFLNESSPGTNHGGQ